MKVWKVMETGMAITVECKLNSANSLMISLKNGGCNWAVQGPEVIIDIALKKP